MRGAVSRGRFRDLPQRRGGHRGQRRAEILGHAPASMIRRAPHGAPLNSAFALRSVSEFGSTTARRSMTTASLRSRRCATMKGRWRLARRFATTRWAHRRARRRGSTRRVCWRKSASSHRDRRGRRRPARPSAAFLPLLDRHRRGREHVTSSGGLGRSRERRSPTAVSRPAVARRLRAQPLRRAGRAK